MLTDAMVQIDCRAASIGLAKSAASDNHPYTRPPLLILIDAPFSSRLSLRQAKPRRGERACRALKPFAAVQGVQLPPGKGQPASRKRVLHGCWQHHS